MTYKWSHKKLIIKNKWYINGVIKNEFYSKTIPKDQLFFIAAFKILELK
jgi:hypothetical protein